MKKLIYILLSLVLFWSCEEPDSGSTVLKVSETTFDDVDAQGFDLAINVTSNSSWMATSYATWCTLNQSNGKGDTKLVITVKPNIGQDGRSTKVTVKSGSEVCTINITQQSSSGEFHYRLPVIFHILYKDQSDKNQYVKEGRMAEIIAKCNKLYEYGSYNVGMNLEFEMATHDPSGKALSEPGVERVVWTTPTMDCVDFMKNNSTTNAKLLWNPEKYINVMVYTFSKPNIMGISHLPYIKSPSEIEGLNELDFKPVHSSLKFPYCVSLNNAYIYIQSDDQYSYATDVIHTLSHELGHYIGLYHTFSESENDNDCLDTDYCADTPSYNIALYNDWLEQQIDAGVNSMSALAKRTKCGSSETYTARNIMDYWVTYSDQFTTNQRERVRYVLGNCALMPGPKAVGRATEPITEGPVDLPIRVMQ